MLHRPTTTWRDHYNPLRGLTMARVVAMEDAAARGQFADLQWFWHFMERTDVTVQSAIARRLAFVDSIDWEIRITEGADPTLAQEQADLLRYAYNRIDNLKEATLFLARVWPRIEAVKFTSLSKAQLVQRLIVAVEQRQVSWPRAWETVTDEMKRYEYAIGASGAITYSAPEGFHDDCVMALALATSGLQRGNAGRFLSFERGQHVPALTNRARAISA